jgi:hypothetical protein
MVTRDTLTAMNTQGVTIDIDTFDRESTLKRYRAWGEYGPQAGDCVEISEFRAKNMVAARAHALAQLKKCPQWDRMGKHNIYVEEITQ